MIMIELEKFLELLFVNTSNDDNIKISKKLKYGFPHYLISLDVQVKSDPQSHWTNISILLDNRNNCIEMSGHSIEDQIVIEDEQLTKKWSKKCEDYLNFKLNKDIETAISNILNISQDKSLLRQYQMDKIFNKDEPI